MRRMLSRIWGAVRRREVETEIEEEVRGHMEMLAARFVAQGMTPAEAGYAARRQFGGVTQMKEHLREGRALPPLDVLVQDARHAFRQLRTARGFGAAAALTLALGIGASTAVFAVLDAVVLRPLPFAEPDRLMAFRSIDRRGTPHPTSLSYPTFFDFRAQNRVFERLVSYRDSRFTLTDSQPALQVAGEIVSWDLFQVLGVRPELGRGFQPDEEKPGRDAVVLSHRLWQTRFNGDPGIVGRAIRMNGVLFTVTGVAPAGFQFPIDAPESELWTTLADDARVSDFTPLLAQRGARVLNAIGRLKPGVTAAQARAQMDQVAAALAVQYPDDNKNVAKTSVMPEQERLGGRGHDPLWTLFGAVGLVMLIACANVANLLVARSTERAREFTLRSAMGASRAALARQLLLESLALGLVGTVGGIMLAVGALRAILPLAGDVLPRIAQARIDGRVLAFTAAAAILTSVLFSVAPLIQVVRADLASGIRESALNIARGRHRLRSALVVGQIVLGLVLLVGAEMLMTSFLQLARRDPGFQPAHLLTFGVGIPPLHHAAEEVAFGDRMIERLRAIPGVRAVATGAPLPLEGEQMTVSFDIEGRSVPPPERPRANIAIVTPGYFGVMGIPLLRGRDFTERDDTSAPRALVVNEAFARKYFPGEEAVGKRILSGATNGKEGSRMREIVGVVGNARQEALGAEPEPIYYFPYKQLSWFIGTVVMRTEMPPLRVESAARAALGELDRRVPMYHVRTGEEMASAAVAQPRFLMVLMASFAGIALLLTVIGLYGVLSYDVARRRREIGVRIALGAGRGKVLGLVFREAMRLVAAGLVLGIAGAAGAARLLESVAFGMPVDQAAIVAGASGLMILTSIAAAYVPAARAARVDPMQTLRSE
jgi:putative ABC transport system permease protein